MWFCLSLYPNNRSRVRVFGDLSSEFTTKYCLSYLLSFAFPFQLWLRWQWKSPYPQREILALTVVQIVKFFPFEYIWVFASRRRLRLSSRFSGASEQESTFVWGAFASPKREMLLQRENDSESKLVLQRSWKKLPVAFYEMRTSDNCVVIVGRGWQPSQHSSLVYVMRQGNGLKPKQSENS